MRPWRWLLLVVVAATAMTLLISLTSVVRFGYRSPSLHVAAETASALISLLAAQLMYGRFRHSLHHRDLLLTSALVLFVGANLFSAVPAIGTLGEGSFSTWAPAIVGALATAVFAAGAVAAPEPKIRRPTPAARLAGCLCLLTLAAVAVAVVGARDWLPEAIAPTLPPEAAPRQRFVGEPSILALQLVGMGLFVVAAIGFAIRAERTRDVLTLWFAIGATLGAFAGLNDVLFASQHSEFFTTGDLLRLGLFTAVLVGVMQEIRLSQLELERAAVHHERRRLARDIHDGLAQDLAFIVQQVGTLDRSNGNEAAATQIATAARHALDESRLAIDALARPTDEPLAQAIARVAEAAAERWGATVETASGDGLELPMPAREAVLRIVREAVTNAARHGQARRIRVQLAAQPARLVSIVDDGIGFDSGARQHNGHHGIAGMHDRAEQIGAQLHVQSHPGEGTRIVVTLP